MIGTKAKYYLEEEKMVTMRPYSNYTIVNVKSVDVITNKILDVKK